RLGRRRARLAAVAVVLVAAEEAPGGGGPTGLVVAPVPALSGDGGPPLSHPHPVLARARLHRRGPGCDPARRPAPPLPPAVDGDDVGARLGHALGAPGLVLLLHALRPVGGADGLVLLGHPLLHRDGAEGGRGRGGRGGRGAGGGLTGGGATGPGGNRRRGQG